MTNPAIEMTSGLSDPLGDPNLQGVSITPAQAAEGLNQADLETVLIAWQSATDRLQTTHELLRHEIARLSDELEAKNRELARQNRLADLGRMAAHVAHEVRNSLMPMTLYLSLLQRKVEGDAETQRIVSQIQSGFTGLETTVSDLLSFTSERDPERITFSIRELVVEVVHSLAPQFDSQHIAVSIDVTDELELWADVNMVRRALLNLVLNAVDAMPQGGELVVAGEQVGDRVILSVADSGMGLAEEVLAKLFDPFVTTKSEGTGLGLAIVERIVDAHGGQAFAQNRPAGGAVFKLEFPKNRSGS